MMRLKALGVALVVGIAGSAVWAAAPRLQVAGEAKAKIASQPGVISLVDVPPGAEEQSGTGTGSEATALKSSAVAKGAAPPGPLSLQQALEAVQKLPGGGAALEQVAALRGTTAAQLLAAASRVTPPPPSPMAPTDWNAGVVLSLHRLATRANAAGSAYLTFSHLYLRGDLLPTTYWPQHDAAALCASGAPSPRGIPGRGTVDLYTTAVARLTILDHASWSASEAYVIEVALRDIQGTHRWTPHLYANGVYLPIARVGDTDRYLGIASLRGGYGGLDVFYEGSGPVAFYYLKIQRITG